MTDEMAASVWKSWRGSFPDSIERLPTGLMHFVFRVTVAGEKYILRVGKPGNRNVLRGNLYWIERLGNFKLPIPRVIAADTEADWPYIVLSYIDGRDLGALYADLDGAQKKVIAHDLWKVQKAVSVLATNGRYGYLHSMEDVTAKASWKEVVAAHISRSRSWIRKSMIFDEDLADMVEDLLAGFDDYFAQVEPRAFFDDATTKNVLIHEGRFSGLVDIDCLCFGDRLYNIALTRMALLEIGGDPDYIDYLIHEEGMGMQSLEPERRRALDFYTLVFCLDFMGGLGMQFNKESVPEVNKIQENNLLRHFWNLKKTLQV